MTTIRNNEICKRMKNKYMIPSQVIILLLFFPIWIDGQENFPEPIQQQMDSIFSNYENNPGCAVAVVKNGKTVFQRGYGLANLEYDIPVSTKTVFDANAMAKQVTAACVFKLVKSGKIKLDDSVTKFFPEFPTYPEGKLMVKNLLYQTSGLRSYLAILFSQNRYFGDLVNNEDVLHMLKKQRNLNFKPGSRQDLSNSNYVLLANIIAKVSGQTFAEYAKEKIFDPLNMTHTFFADSQNKVIKNRAIAYQEVEGNFLVDHYFNSTVVGDGALLTNLEDMVKWTKSLSTGAVLGNSLVSQLITSGTLNSGLAANYAGGLFVQDHYDIEGLTTVRHSGDWAGFRSLFYKFLNEDTAFIILSNNASTNVWALLDQLTPVFLADEIAEAQRLAASNTGVSTTAIEIKLDKKEVQKFTGNFFNTIDGNLRSVELLDGKLHYKRDPNSPGSPLTVTSSDELVFEALPIVKLSFGQAYKTMTFSVNNQNPILFHRYQNIVYTQKELKEYENNFYNEDLEVIYQVKSKDGQLQILIEGKELVVLTPFTKDRFREEHFGYLTFKRDQKGNITSFSRTDNTFTNLVFQVLKSNTL